MVESKPMVPDEILTEILARLPIRSIFRSKSVSKRWKFITETSYFRNLFIFLHQNSSSSWSLISSQWPPLSNEIISFPNCKKWNLPKSLGSYISSNMLSQDMNTDEFIVESISGELLLISTSNNILYVGSQVLQKWVKIPSSPYPQEANLYVPKFGLATHVENDIVLGYKVVLIDATTKNLTSLNFQVYSSDTKIWTCLKIQCPRLITTLNLRFPYPISLNRKLHWLEHDLNNDDDVGSLVAYDFYDDNDQCQIIPFPIDQDLDHLNVVPLHERKLKRSCSISKGSIMYMNMSLEHKLKIWKLKEYTKDSGEWDLIWELNLESLGFGVNYVPMAMDPFKIDVVYLWNRQEKCLVLSDLRMKKIRVCNEFGEDCVMGSLMKCKKYMETICGSSHYETFHPRVFYAPQIWFTPWLEFDFM